MPTPFHEVASMAADCLKTPVLACESGFCQAAFHRRWGHLRDKHVRTLAWLIDAPDLLDPGAAQWQGRIATLSPDAAERAADWLAALDFEPGSLHAFLDLPPYARLGRYAEKLMAFYFLHCEILVAHGVQVRAGKNDTIGEFDFLLRDATRLMHWEFATKFYLLQAPDDAGTEAGHEADYFVGPNLADTLGAKMDKILFRQLVLGNHPAARIHLPQPVDCAQALIKGWLFYRSGELSSLAPGLSPRHCRGFWCTLSEFMELPVAAAGCYAVLPRLDWLAPARIPAAETLARENLYTLLSQGFETDTMPVMVALLTAAGEFALEAGRAFIVPDDWRRRAGERISRVRSE